MTYFDTFVFVLKNALINHYLHDTKCLSDKKFLGLRGHVLTPRRDSLNLAGQPYCTSMKITSQWREDKNVFSYTLLLPLISPSSCHGLTGVPLLIVSAAIASIRPEMESNRQSWFAFPLAQLLRWATTTAEPSKPCAGAQSMANESFPNGGVVTVKTSCRFDRW